MSRRNSVFYFLIPYFALFLFCSAHSCSMQYLIYFPNSVDSQVPRPRAKLRLKFRTKAQPAGGRLAAVLRYIWYVGPTTAWASYKKKSKSRPSQPFCFSSSIALFNAAFPCYKQRMTASGPYQSRLISHVGNSEKASKQEGYVSLVLVFHVWRPCGSRRVSIESACDGLASPRRLQQTSEISGPGGPACILREDAAVCSRCPMGSRCEACCANLSAICSVCLASAG